MIDNNNTIYAFIYLSDVVLLELGYQSIDDGDSWDAIPDEGYINDSDHSPNCSLITPSQYIFIGTWNSGIIRTAAPVVFGN